MLNFNKHPRYADDPQIYMILNLCDKWDDSLQDQLSYGWGAV